MLQRIVAAILLIRFCIVHVADTPLSAAVVPHFIGACAAMLFLIGFWTPFVGTLITLVELWIAMTHLSDPWTAILLATIGATSVMLGPGAFSIDARLYGRRHLEI